MTAPVPLMAVRWDPTRGGPEAGQARFQRVLEAVIRHPYWFSAPSTDAGRIASAATLLSDPFNMTWEVWRGGEFVGLLLLWRIQPSVDALFHFVFFDQNLTGKRTLLLDFLAYCYLDLGFRRISIEVPEFVSTMISFARRKLGFHYEGEGRTVDHPAIQRLGVGTIGLMEHPNLWVAQQGSRREGCHFHNDAWHDVICLRQTAEEYAAFTQERSRLCPPPSSPPPSPPLSEASLAKSSAPSKAAPKPLSPPISPGPGPIRSTSSTTLPASGTPQPD